MKKLIFVLALPAAIGGCRFEPGALAGGDINNPWGYPSQQQRSCAYRHIADGQSWSGNVTSYLSAYKLDDMSRWEVEKGMLKIRFTPYNDGGTPRLAKLQKISYQFLQKYQQPVVRELSCKDVTDPQDVARYRYYQCAIAKKNDPIDSETFYFHSMTIQLDGDDKSYSFTETIPSGGCYGSSQEDIREVKLNGVVLPTLVPREGPGT